jgi:processing peptidase subunit beta
VAFKGASWTDPDAVALQVMQTLLGAWDKRSSAAGNMGSELSQTVAANGLADSVMAFNTNYRDTGLFGVYATADPHASDLEDLAWTIMHKVTGLCYSVDESAVARAKNALKASLLFQGDGSMGQAEELGRSLLVYGRAVPRAEMMARIDAVDAAAVKAVANRFVLDQEIAVSALGDTQFLPDYTWLRRRTFWLRY